MSSHDKKNTPNSSENQGPDVKPQEEKRLKPIPFTITFIVMFLMWLVFSGKFDLFHMSLGVISCLIVAAMSSDLLITDTRFNNIPIIWGRFMMYFPWLLWQIVLSNIHVLKLVYSKDPLERINPQMVYFKSRLKNDMALVTFANSITLTPGTITVALSVLGDFAVHAIDDTTAGGLPGDMEPKSGHIFGE
ncbi:MAG: Na+/H+ antiporter subunit E [Desulfobacteraceae bacterium]